MHDPYITETQQFRTPRILVLHWLEQDSPFYNVKFTYLEYF